MADTTVKVLLCGEVKGNLKALYDRVATVSKKAGPFAVIFCVGPFCPEEEGKVGDLADYLDGKLEAPIPTYFIDAYPGGRGVIDARPIGENGSVAPNLFFLQGGGVRTIAGLKVAFLGGHHDALSYHDTSAMGAIAAVAAGEYRQVDVASLLRDLAAPNGGQPLGPQQQQLLPDLLLTSEWPRGVALNAGVAPPPEVAACSLSGTGVVAELASEVQPRYHVAGVGGVFYAREPYKNPKCGHVTRFIGLGAVGNPHNQKWLHALALTPASTMDPAKLAANTADTTQSPYLAPPAKAQQQGGKGGGQGRGEQPDDGAGGGGQSWRWQMPGDKGGGGRPAKRPRTSDKPPDPEATVFVRNIPFSADELALKQFFEGCGAVVDVRIAYKQDGKPRGFAHVEFDDPAAAERALQLTGTPLNGREISVEASAQKPPREKQEKPLSETVVFVANVPAAATDDDLTKFFEGCGAIAAVRVATTAEGERRGFAHVEFAERSGAEAAVALSGSELQGQALEVKPAVAQQRREPRELPRVVAPGEPAPGCWFCLSNQKDVHLIVSIQEECYLALDKGGLCPEHVLIVPVEHFPSASSLPASANNEIKNYTEALRRCFAEKLGAELLQFERFLVLRGKGGNHAHINCVAVPRNAAPKAKQAFVAAATAAGFQFQELHPGPTAEDDVAALHSVVGGDEYFCVTLPDGSRLVHPIAKGERFNMQFGREVVAGILGAPHKADWRNCTLDSAGEEARSEQFKALFGPYEPGGGGQ